MTLLIVLGCIYAYFLLGFIFDVLTCRYVTGEYQDLGYYTADPIFVTFWPIVLIGMILAAPFIIISNLADK